MDEALAHPLPGNLRRLFWEYDFSQRSWEHDAPLITQRTLTHGGWDDIRWLHTIIGDAGIRAAITLTRGRGCTPRQLRYWETVLDLPHQQVRAWLSLPGRQLWDDR